MDVAIAAPKSGTTIALPKLPVGSFDFNPNATDTIVVDGLTTAALPDGPEGPEGPGGYDAMRAHAFDPLTSMSRTTPGVLVYQTQYSPNL